MSDVLWMLIVSILLVVVQWDENQIGRGDGDKIYTLIFTGIFCLPHHWFQALSWDLSPITVIGWLNIFMQLTNVENIEDSKEKFVFPQYSGHAFSQVSISALPFGFVDYGFVSATVPRFTLFR